MDTSHFDIDIGSPLPRWVEVPAGHAASTTIWLHGRPLGRIPLPRRGPTVYRRGLARAIGRQLSEPILRQLIRNGLATPGNTSLELERLLTLAPVADPVKEGELSVVVCTRGERPDLLERCLDGLARCDVAPAEVVVVRFGSGGSEPDAARQAFDAVAARGGSMRWIVAADADLARARGVGVAAVSTPFVAFVDESVRVDRHWVAAICRTFRHHPQALAVTGSVLPGDVEPEPARLLAEAEERMEWGGRLEFRWWQPEPDRPSPREWLNVLRLGSDANMAFRVAAIRRACALESIVDGDLADAGQHLDAWLRLLERGHAVIREPAASGRDAGIGSIAEAERLIRRTAAGISAALMAAAVRRRSDFWSILLLASWFVRSSLVDSIRRRGSERSLAWARLRGHLAGSWRGIVAAFGKARPAEAVGERDGATGRDARSGPYGDDRDRSPFRGGRLVPIELAEGNPDHAPVRALRSARHERTVDLLACWNGRVLGTIHAVTGGRRLTLPQLRWSAVDRHFATFLLRHLEEAGHPHEFDGSDRRDREARALDRVRRRLLGRLFPPLPNADRPADDATVSIVVPTCDRPDDLRACLEAILAQKTDRTVEVIVVDNRPGSGRTPAVLADFPGVRLVSETRQGSSYARNRGLMACRGSIVVFCDDDIHVPENWLAAMLAPFDEPSVGVVTGNIVPHSLETAAERLNEATCGLGRGSEPFAVDGDWFHGSRGPVQGWDFGTTANAAVRIGVFRDPAVGLFAESLGPGTPVGAGEDPYFFYRVLKSGYRIEYLPDAWVWHRHRTSAKAIRRQVYNYAKSAVGYHLLTLVVDGDRRARSSLLGGLQRYYLRRLFEAILGRADVPARIVLVEMAGNLAGGFALLRSEFRRRRLARDPAYPPTPTSLPAADGPASDDEPWVLGPVGADAAPAAAGSIRVRARRPGRLPHFLVIGAQKSGTTALHHNLGKHPSIEFVPNFRARLHDWDNRKETSFFSGGSRLYGIRTLDEYRMLFNDNGLVQGEACPGYETARALDAIRAAMPDVKLILTCREPVSRLESAYNHMRQWHAQVPELERWTTWDPKLSFEANLQAELANPAAHGLVRVGMYADAVTRVLERFRPGQLLVLVAEEYRADPQSTYDRICDFLEVPSARINHWDAHVREHTYRLTDEQWRRMAEFYRPHNERFFRLIGRELPEWDLTAPSPLRIDPHAA